MELPYNFILIECEGGEENFLWKLNIRLQKTRIT